MASGVFILKFIVGPMNKGHQVFVMLCEWDLGLGTPCEPAMSTQYVVNFMTATRKRKG